MNGAPPAVAAASRRRRRRRIFACLGLLGVWLLCELFGVIAWTFGTGSMFTFERAAAARAAAREGSGASALATKEAAAAQNAISAVSAAHPYLGFVYDATRDIGVPLSPWGFVDDAPPLRRRAPDRFVLGVVGGSVSLQLAVYAEAELVAALQRSPSLAGKTIDVVRLGLGGYKQPQQLLAIELLLALGGEFDCIVNLDGYNEIALVDENLPHGVPAWYPRSWARLQDGKPAPDQLQRLGHLAVLREQRGELAATAETMAWSPLWQFVWWWRDQKRVERIGALRVAIERAAVAPAFAVTGPGIGGQTPDAARQEMVALWARASRQLHAVCKAHGIHYCHFLQPNQYVAGQKPIGAEEAKVALVDDARGQAVAAFYPRLQAEGEALARSGVPFTDLTGIFRDHAEPLYNDACCHLNLAGNRILAEHVAAGVRRQLELAGLVVRKLVAEPARLDLTSPLGRQRLRIVATDDRGQTHDLGGVGFGVRYGSDPAGLVAVNPDGGVAALRRGSGTIQVEYGGVSMAVPFTTAWPDHFEGGDGRAMADGAMPRLQVGPRADGAFAVQCSGMPETPYRVLVLGRRPLPESPVGAELGDLTTVPVAGPGQAAHLSVPAPTAGDAPWFLRLYCLDATATKVLAASPTVVCTGA